MNNEIEKKFRVDSKKAINQMLSAPLIVNNYEFSVISEDKVLDVYYDTPQMFLKSAGVLIRTRTVGKTKNITIKTDTQLVKTAYGTYTTCKEFNYEIPYYDTIFNYIELIMKNIPFSVYARLKVDLLSVLNSMRPFLVVDQKSTRFHVYSNLFKCQYIFSQVKYVNQENGKKEKDFIIELQSYPDNVNLEKFFEFASRIEKSVKPIFAFDKTKFEMGLELTKSAVKKK